MQLSEWTQCLCASHKLGTVERVAHRGRSNTIISPGTSPSLTRSLIHIHTETHLSLKFHEKKIHYVVLSSFLHHIKLMAPLFTGTHASAVYRVLLKHSHYYFLLPPGSSGGQRKNNWPNESPICGESRGASDRCLCVEQQSPGADDQPPAPPPHPSPPSSSVQPLGAITSTCCRKEQCPCSADKGSQLRKAKLTSNRFEVLTSEGFSSDTFHFKNRFLLYNEVINKVLKKSLIH